MRVLHPPSHPQLFNNLPLLVAHLRDLLPPSCSYESFKHGLRSTQNMTKKHLAKFTYATSKDKNPPLSEYPSETVTIKILCHRGVDVNPLKRIPDLQDFEIKRERNNPNIIVFKGIYPDNNFDEDSILELVQQYDENARFA